MNKTKKTITYASLPFDELPREKLKAKGFLSEKQLEEINIKTTLHFA
jgi:hypothetical protein